MKPADLESVLGVLRANWNLRLTPAQANDQARTFLRYLQDLDITYVKAALDQLVLEDGPPPHAGTVRRLAIDLADPEGVPPSPDRLWLELRGLADRLEGGLPYGVPSRWLSVMLEHGKDLLGLRTNSDRDMFTRLCKEEIRRYEMERYGLP